MKEYFLKPNVKTALFKVILKCWTTDQLSLSSLLLRYRTNKISLRLSQFLLVYPDSRRMRCEAARPQTSFASATKYDLL